MIYLNISNNISNNISILIPDVLLYNCKFHITAGGKRDPSSYPLYMGKGKCEEIEVLPFSMTIGDKDPSSFPLYMEKEIVKKIK